MAGGTGSRLWPLSRELYPKQFICLHGQNSMLQETVNRLSGIETRAPVVICNEEHRFLVAEQLRQINQLSNNIILEPAGRNTAPAIALAALNAIRREKTLSFWCWPPTTSLKIQPHSTPPSKAIAYAQKGVWSRLVSSLPALRPAMDIFSAAKNYPVTNPRLIRFYGLLKTKSRDCRGIFTIGRILLE